MGWFNHQSVILSGRNVNTEEVMHSSILNRVVSAENAILIQPEEMTLRKYNIWYIQKMNFLETKIAAFKVCFSFRRCLMLQKRLLKRTVFSELF